MEGVSIFLLKIITKIYKYMIVLLIVFLLGLAVIIVFASNAPFISWHGLIKVNPQICLLSLPTYKYYTSTVLLTFKCDESKKTYDDFVKDIEIDFDSGLKFTKLGISPINVIDLSECTQVFKIGDSVLTRQIMLCEFLFGHNNRYFGRRNYEIDLKGFFQVTN